MAHTYSAYKNEYTVLLGKMQITRTQAVNEVANRLVGYYRAGKYGNVPQRTGIPAVWIAASFEREASSDFRCSPAQGDRWNKKSVHVPAGRGPFTSWTAAAIDAYHLDSLDKIGVGNWSWEMCCYYGELFNGFGYRSHGIPSPYLWGGTNLQRRGKYVADGKYDSTVMDTQLGITPIMKRMIELEPLLDFTKAAPTGMVVAPPAASPRVLPPVKSEMPTVHPAAGPAAIVVAAVGGVSWWHEHWVLIVLGAIAAICALAFLLRKPSPPQSPKAIDPA